VDAGDIGERSDAVLRTAGRGHDGSGASPAFRRKPISRIIESPAGADRELAMMWTLADAIARRRSTIWFLLFAITTAVLASAQIAAEESYPSRPIRLIIPFPPGGPTDVMGRLISSALSNELGQQVYVDNRPGAGSTLAGKIAANAEPDGYTLLLGSAATLAIGPTLYRDVEYDPKRFVPVAMVAEVPYVMVASPKAPVASVRELIAYAKAHPGKLNFGVPNGAPPHMLAAWFKSLTDIDVVLVTYRGGANVLTDLLGGQIDLAVETCSILLPQLRDGKLRPLGTPSPKRLTDLPDVPTMAENGVPGFTASSWTGIVAPPGTSTAIVDKLNRATNAALKNPATQGKLKPLEAQAMFGTPADYADFLVSELPKWITMAKLSGATTE
jgi:tripartite-type tricarboxylate transporter receptor subunit TctC